MQIWVDADACPNVIKEILFKAAARAGIVLTLVANQTLAIPRSKFIKSIRVAPGFDIADNEIVKRLSAGDLVITADIPLAAAAVANGAYALNPRGEFYTTENIKERLNMRDFMDTLRASGVDTGGPAALNLSERRAFANELDRFITRHAKYPS
ncbi:MAG TPA: YaiI/YqxD family protein [Gammaproteobacteria bacterium]